MTEPAAPPLRLLLLAGTAEARALAGRLAAAPGLAVTASLAGATAEPARYPVAVRVGGFGGAGALAEWLAETGVGAVIDATHPFAERISANAAAACAARGVPLLRLLRPPWSGGPGQRWREVESAEAAAAALPPGVMAFLATGKGGLAAFLARKDVGFVLRVVDAAPPPAANLRVLFGRPPFAVEDEIATLRESGAGWLVSKNSGGATGRAKLEAARALGLEVLMIARPKPPEGVETVETVEAAAEWAMRLAALRLRAAP
jgi:precorrin-6A/cobalt-precorrin-6A reductase